MSFLTRMKSRARRDPKKLVLPEGTDIRMIKAAKQILDQDYASSVVLLGDPEEILRRAATEGCSLEGVSLELPGANGRLAEYTSELHRLRKHKGVSHAEARACIVEPLNWGAMMVRTAAVDAMVAGADCPTAQVLRSALAIIKTRSHTRLASSYFVMHLPDSTWGMEGYMLFSDCAMNPDPDAEQLAEIAVSTTTSPGPGAGSATSAMPTTPLPSSRSAFTPTPLPTRYGNRGYDPSAVLRQSSSHHLYSTSRRTQRQTKQRLRAFTPKVKRTRSG